MPTVDHRVSGSRFAFLGRATLAALVAASTVAVGFPARAQAAPTEGGGSGVIEVGETVTLPVEIPATTSTGSIKVEKGHEDTRVQFIDPRGRDVTNVKESDESTFELRDEPDTAASLRVTDPIPGTWMVSFAFPRGAPRQSVAASWEGQINSSVTLDPGTRTPGQPLVVTVRVRLLTSRDMAIAGPDLKLMTFNAVLLGDDFQSLPVPLANDGMAPDGKADDREFAGQMTVPDPESGTICAQGSVSAPGFTSYFPEACIGPRGARKGGATMTFSGTTVAPGEFFPGTLAVENPGEARRVRLDLADVPGATLIRQEILVPARATAFVHEFTIVFDPQASTGTRRGTLRAVDADSDEVLGSAPVFVDVEFPPGWAGRNWYVFPFSVVGLLLARVVFRLLRRALILADVQQLSVSLERDDEVDLLHAPKHWSSAFVFDIKHDGGALKLAPAKGRRHHVVRRGRHGMLTLSLPNGGRETFRPEQPVPLPRGVVAVVRDGRATHPGGDVDGPVDPGGKPGVSAGAKEGPVEVPRQHEEPNPAPSTTPPPPLPTGKTAGVRLFVSYSHNDEKHREQLRISLSVLSRQSRVTMWDDRKLVGGVNWDKEIDSRLEAAEVIILLVTPYYLASPYAYPREATRALARYHEGTARVIPVIVRPCDWENTPLGELQALPEGAKPVTKWDDEDDAWLAVARGVRQAILNGEGEGADADADS